MSTALAADVMRITVSGYRLVEDTGIGVRELDELPGLSVSPTSGQVYSNAVSIIQNQNVFTVEVPFGYRLSHWVKAIDDQRFERTLGEKIEGSEGATTLTVPYDPSVGWLYVVPVVDFDDNRQVTVAKSRFGEGTVGTNLGVHASQKGDVFRLAAVPKRGADYDHSTFRQWENGSTNYLREAVVDSNETYVAEFVPNSWTVTFNAEGGKVFPTSKTVTCDATYGWLPKPTRTGHQFAYWYVDRSAGSKITANTRVEPLGDHTLHAYWDTIRLTIDWSRIGDGNGEVTGAGTYPYGEKARLEAEPLEDSMFVGWSDGETRNPRFVTVISNAEYVAEFAIRTYEVNFAYYDSEGKPQTFGPQIVRHGGRAEPPAEAEYGRYPEHTFKTWSTEEYKSVTRDLTVDAIYDVVTYRVSFVYRNRDGNCVTTMPQHVESGAAAVPPGNEFVNNWTGHHFVSWSTDYVSISADTVIEAIYEIDTYDITFSYRDSAGEPATWQESAQYSNEVSFAFVNEAADKWKGHRLLGWSLNGRPVDEATYVATGNHRLEARYEGYSQISFDPGEGSGEMAPQVYTNFTGEVDLPPNAFTNTGHAFLTWLDKSNGQHYPDQGVVKVTEGENIVLTAEWEPIEYTIALDANGGTCKIDPQSATYGEEKTFVISSPGVGDQVTKTGYTLLPYWSREATRTNELHWMTTDGSSRNLVVSNLTTVAGERVTLYAQWDPHRYTVKFDLDGGSGPSDPLQFVYDQAQVLPSEGFTRPGYVFKGWLLNGELLDASVSNLTPDDGATVTLTAYWEELPHYDVRFNPNGGTGSMPSQRFTCGEPQALTPNAFGAPALMAFDGWTNSAGKAFADCEVVCDLTTEPDAIVDLYANWADVPSYEIAYDGNGATDGSMATVRVACGAGGTLTPNRFAKTGYAFSCWTNEATHRAYADGAKFAEDLAPTNGTATLKAQWEPNRYAVTFDGNGADGGEEMEAQEFTYDIAQALTKNGFTKTGYAFAGWAVAEGGDGKVAYADGEVVSNLTAAADGRVGLSAVWQPKKYEIRYDSAGGTAVGVQSNDCDSVVNAPADPTRTGYDFDAWYLGDRKFEFGTATMPAENLVLTAHWTAHKYEVWFNANGGSGTMDSQQFAYDQPQALSANLFTAPDWKVFDCWTDANGKTYKNGAIVSNLTDEANGVVELTATWTEKPSYSVEFAANGGEGKMPTLRFACGEGGTLASNKFVRIGYAFANWTNEATHRAYADGAKFAEDLALTNGTATLKALWAPNRYAVTFDGNGADGGEEMKAQEFTYDIAQALTKNGFTKTGHAFANWTNAVGDVYADGEVVSNLTAVADGTNVLVAVWKVLSYEIRFESVDGALVGVQSNAFGSAVAKPGQDPTRTGYAFDGWYLGEDEFKFDTMTMPAKDIVLTAHWKPNRYTVRFNPNGGTGKPYGQEFDYGSAQNLLSNAFGAPDDWMVFDKWTNGVDNVTYGNGELVSNLTDVAAGVIDLYATWKFGSNYEVAFDGNGCTSGKMEPVRFECGKGGTLPQVGYAKTGYTFSCWTNGATGATYGNGAKFSEDLASEGATATLKALWAPNRYWVRFDGNGATDGGMAVQEFTYDVEAKLAANGYEKEGHAFVQWTNDEERVFADQVPVVNLTAIADGTNVLFAVWKAKSYEIRFDSNGGSPVGVQTNEYGSAVSKPTAPTKTGYRFSRWLLDGDEFDFAKMPAKNVTLVADWMPITYKVKFHPGSGTGVETEQVFTYDVAQNLAQCTFTAPDWQVFDVWKDGNGNSYEDQQSVLNLTAEQDACVELTATWTVKPSYSVEFEANGGEGEMPTLRFACGEGGALASNRFTRTGYAFAQWKNEVSGATYGNGAKFAEDLAPTNGTATLTAQWEPNKYTVTFDGNGATGGSTPEQSFTYDVAQALAKNGFTKTGCDFAGWAVAEGGDGKVAYADGEVVSNLTAAADGIVKLTAVWNVHRYKVVWEGTGDTDNYAYGEKVDKHSDPTREGNVFGGWMLNGIIVEFPYAMPDHDVTFVAKWTPITYTIAFNANGGSGSSMPSIPVTYGEEVTLSKNTYTFSGHIFSGWSTDKNGKVQYADEATVSNLTVKAEETVTLFAVWTEHGNPLSIALGLPASFEVSVSAEGAWTVAEGNNGLQRTGSSPNGELRIEIPGPGELYGWYVYGERGGNSLVWKFNDKVIRSIKDGENYFADQFNTAGTLVIQGSPDGDATWKLYGFEWTPEVQ